MCSVDYLQSDNLCILTAHGQACMQITFGDKTRRTQDKYTECLDTYENPGYKLLYLNWIKYQQ